MTAGSRCTATWRAKNPEKLRAQRKRYRAKHRVKLTAVARHWQRKKLRIKNLPPEPPFGTPCEICKQVDEHHLAADHDHKTGEFRGWICRACNRGIGSLADDPARVFAALLYLTR